MKRLFSFKKIIFSLNSFFFTYCSRLFFGIRTVWRLAKNCCDSHQLDNVFCYYLQTQICLVCTSCVLYNVEKHPREISLLYHGICGARRIHHSAVLINIHYHRIQQQFAKERLVFCSCFLQFLLLLIPTLLSNYNQENIYFCQYF